MNCNEMSSRCQHMCCYNLDVNMYVSICFFFMSHFYIFFFPKIGFLPIYVRSCILHTRCLKSHWMTWNVLKIFHLNRTRKLFNKIRSDTRHNRTPQLTTESLYDDWSNKWTRITRNRTWMAWHGIVLCCVFDGLDGWMDARTCVL